MHDQIDKFAGKLIAQNTAIPGMIGFAAWDDAPVKVGNPYLAQLAADILTGTSALAVVAAQPSLPWSDFLIQRSLPQEKLIIPRDTETRTFLHDIPFLRRSEWTRDLGGEIARMLAGRKGVIVEGLGIIATGAMTVEQAYINYSSVFHATFLKYLQNILHEGFLLQGESEAFGEFRSKWLRPLSADGLIFRVGPFDEPAEILSEIATVGRYTVERGLVDSFFGNISARSGDTIYISQTAASLDELDGCIDPVPADNSSTAGITASSELLAHRRIYEGSDARVILHGHPKFTVIMSMICEEADCPVKDCWKDCTKMRMICDVPVVSGEIGAGGLAEKVPPAIAGPGKAIVYGHGLFTIGRRDFEEAFRAMVEVENCCRDEYFRRMKGREISAG
jgi:ribulose-5-phosphate 4-epimerase/fuculose-1-phosphate aldolase